MKMDVNKTLEQLAEAFNTTVEQLYPILIKQAYVAGIQSVLIFLVPVIMLLVLYRLASKKKMECKGHWDWIDPDDGGLYLGAMVVLGIITFITGIFMIEVAPTAFLNPEYWAIQEVLKTVALD